MKNTFIKVLSVVLALSMLASVFCTTVLAAEHEHEYTETKTVAPTCRANGYTAKVCACGDEQIVEQFDALDECAEADLEDLPASEATCTEPAYEAGKKCKVCGTEYPGAAITSKPALNHEYDLVIVEPTCGVEGKISKVCQREGCGYEEVLQTINGDDTCNDAGVTADVTAHTYAYVILKAPTCTEAGRAKYYCTKCGDVITDEIPAFAIGHNYGAWVTDTPATCDKAGSKHKTCSNCGDVVREAIDATNHSWTAITAYHDCVAKRNGDDDYTNDVLKFYQEATCYQDGYVWEHCSVCDAIRQATEGKTAHDWDHTDTTKFVDLVIAQAPNKVYYTGTYVEHSDCAQVTHFYNKCVDCGYVELIEELEIEDAHVWKKNADLTTYYKADVTPADDKVCVTTVNYYKVCTECGFELWAYADIAPGHVWEDRFDEDGELQWTYVPYVGTLKPCQNGAANYYIRECVNCDATEDVCKFTEPHVKNVYDCEDPTCTDFACVDCTHAGRKLACSVCHETFGEVCTEESHNLEAHEKATLKTPADCNSKAVYTYECTNANCGHKEDKEYGEFNTSVHDEDKCKIVGRSPATCLAPGVESFYCTNCNIGLIEKPLPALGHTEPVAIGTAKPATCQEWGRTAGEKCSRCGEVFEEQKDIEPDSKNHIGVPELKFSGNATCQYGKLELWFYSECGHSAAVTEEENANLVNHVSWEFLPDADGDGIPDGFGYATAIETVNAVGATCITDGMHGYTRCTLCDVLVTVAANNACNDQIGCNNSTHDNLEALEESYQFATAGNITIVNQVKFNDVKADLVIAKYGHEFSTAKGANTLVPFKYETCTVDGNKAKIECARCEAIDPENDGSVIKAHGTAYTTVIDTYVAPTCTQTGEAEGTWCTKCAEQLDADTCDACDSYGNNTYVIPAVGHNVKGTRYEKSCTAEGFDMWKCENCNALTAAAGEKVNLYYLNGTLKGSAVVEETTPIWLFENYKAAAHTWADVTTDIGATCTEAAKTVYMCTCGAYDATRVEYSETQLATGHTVNGEPVKTLTCEQTCETCSATGHKLVTMAPTCEKNGYEFCTNCTYKNDVAPAIGHEYSHTISYVEETSLEDGLWTWACKNCGEAQETVLVYVHEVEFDIEINPYVDGKDAADLEFVKGGYIEVIVNVTLEDTSFSGLEYALNYNPQYLEFVSVECVYDFGEVAYDFLQTNNGDHIKTTIHFNGEAGILGGEEVALFRYIFKVSPATNYINDSIINHKAIEFDNSTVINISADSVLAYGNIDFVLMGDVTGDGAYNVNDLIAIKKMFGKPELYTNVADVNSDGEVNLADYRAIGKFVNSGKTFADYYTMFGYDIVAILANTTIPNMNGDGVINEVDRELFEATIVNLPATAWNAGENIGFYNEYVKQQ